MYAITIGTTSYRAISSEADLSPGEVLFSGTLTETMVWDSILGNVREINSGELLLQAKAKRILELKDDCTNYIQAGFTSNALGAGYTYDSALPQDQINLVGAKMAGIDMPFTCTDDQGYKSQKPHTVAQIGQVYLDGMIHLQSAKSRFYARKLAVESPLTDTAEKVAAIVW